MGTHDLLNLLNKLGKRDKMRGLPRNARLAFNLFFATSLINSITQRAGMLHSIYHMTLRLLLNLISAVKTLQFCHYDPMLLWTS